MPRDPRAHLVELEKACRYLLRKSDGLSLDEYLSNDDVRFGIERNFIHIGEVLSQLRREFPPLSQQITDAARIVDFRNFLIHRYWDTDHRATWLTLNTKVGPLLHEVEMLLLSRP